MPAVELLLGFLASHIGAVGLGVNKKP